MMQNWPIKEVAFVITPEVLAMMNFLRMKRSETLPEKYNMSEQEFMRKLFDDEINPFEDDLDCVDFLFQALPDIQIHTEFDGTAKTMEDASGSPVELNYEDDGIIYLPLNHTAQYCSAVYHSSEEMSEEIRERIGNLLPGWWDISMTLCEITGTYFC